jgi:hypothetical protein
VVPAEAFTVEFGLLENLELVAVSGKDVNMISIPELDQMSNLRPFGMFDTSINETITVNIGDMTDVVILSLPMNNLNGTIHSQVLRSTHLGKKWIEKL